MDPATIGAILGGVGTIIGAIFKATHSLKKDHSNVGDKLDKIQTDITTLKVDVAVVQNEVAHLTKEYI